MMTRGQPDASSTVAAEIYNVQLFVTRWEQYNYPRAPKELPRVSTFLLYRPEVANEVGECTWQSS